jgi:hypothetical protein
MVYSGSEIISVFLFISLTNGTCPVNILDFITGIILYLMNSINDEVHYSVISSISLSLLLRTLI